MRAPKDLDAELADAIDARDEAQQIVDAKRIELSEAREALTRRRSTVTEITAEIHARVRGGQSTRPMLDGIGMQETSAAFAAATGPAPERTGKAQKPREVATR